MLIHLNFLWSSFFGLPNLRTFFSNSRPSLFSDKSPDRTKVKSVVIPGQLNGSTGSGSEFRASEPDKKMGRNTGPTHTRKLRSYPCIHADVSNFIANLKFLIS